MGCVIICSLFEKFPAFLHWIVNTESNLDTLAHYLDDLIFAEDALTNKCQVLLSKFLEVSQLLRMKQLDQLLY